MADRLFFETFNRPYTPPQAQNGRVLNLESNPGGGRIKATLARWTLLKAKVSLIKVLPQMSFQDA